MSTPKVAIVAALQREVWPLVKNWPVNWKQSGGRQFAFYEKDHTVVVCGGIGSGHARRATEAVIELYRPTLVISAGFAGALQADLPVGRVLAPKVVIDARDGSKTDIGAGEGVLVSFDSVADAQQKAKLAQAYGAQAVDMEAAAVSRGAAAHGLRFMACKVISDASDFSLPPAARFVRHDGQFQTVRFVFYAAMRPWLWKSVLQLARNSALAARRLCQRLAAVGETKIGEMTTTEMATSEIRTEASEPVLRASAPVKS
jgi:adenosylhomocysteine nucleosidase